MGKFARLLGGNLLRVALLLIAVSVVTFALMSLSPVDPVQAYVGAGVSVSPEQRANIAAYWGLDKPPVQRFLAWGSALLRGDFGTSLTYRAPVLEVIGQRAGACLLYTSGVDYPTQFLFGGPTAPFALLRTGAMGLYCGVEERDDYELVAWHTELRPGYGNSIDMRVPREDEIAGKPVHTRFAAVHEPYVLPGESRRLTTLRLEPYAGDWRCV